MPPYLQTCSCKGRAIGAAMDAQRYDSEAEDIRKEIALLEQDVARLREKARRARLRAFDQEIGACRICLDTGVIEGNGSALVGGRGAGIPEVWEPV